jgi:hypothetical protein
VKDLEINFNRAIDALVKYIQEAEACSERKLGLAGTVMWGIAVEAALFLVALTELEEIKAEGLWPKDKKGNEKKIKDWGLGDVLDIAEEKWWKRIGLSEEEVKRARELQTNRNNFSHPAAYLFKRKRGIFPSKTVLKQEATARKIAKWCYDYLIGEIKKGEMNKG